jgi:hypothetical protein
MRLVELQNSANFLFGVDLAGGIAKDAPGLALHEYLFVWKMKMKMKMKMKLEKIN